MKKYIDINQMIKWCSCISHIAPGFLYREDDSVFSISYRFTFGRLKAGRGSVAAVMLSHMVLLFLHDPRNKNLSSVILISTVLFLSAPHPFLIFYLPSPPPFTLQLFSPSPSFSALHLPLLQSPSLSLSPVLIVYIH